MTPNPHTPNPITTALITCIVLYQKFISPLFASTCRFTPTCSAYALDALRMHGAVKGTYLTIRRLSRCAPWTKHPHHDPVPPKEPID